MRGLLLLWTFTVLPAWACSCGSLSTAKEAWQESPLVFVGRAESVDPPPTQASVHTVQLRVHKAFKGVAAAETVTVVQQRTSCDGPPPVGLAMLFYLHRGKDGVLSILQGCYRTGRLDQVGDDLRFLDALPKSAQGTRIAGVARLDTARTPVAGVKVTVTGPDGAAASLQTDASGVYEVFGKPPGTYRIEVAAPPPLAQRYTVLYGRSRELGNPFRRSDGKVEIALPADGSAGVDFILSPNNRMSGVVHDSRGKPLGKVRVDVEPTASSTERLYVSEKTNPDGRFDLAFVPAGAYRLVVNPNGRPTAEEPFSKVYYPGVADPARARLVTIRDGESLTGLDIQVPTVLPVRRLSGRVQFADGKPMPTGHLTFKGEDTMYETVSVQPDGTFVIPVLQGTRGTLRVEAYLDSDTQRYCPHFLREDYAIKTVPRQINVTGEDQSGLVLEFPYASCAAADIEWKRQRAGRRD